jgi:hypothetical protein
MDVTTVLLAEYSQLKAEQIHRIGVRDNLVYATLAAVAAVVVGATQSPAGVHLLLALPPACALLGWTFLANDQRITAIGVYLRDGLTPSLSVAAGAQALGWERHRLDDSRRRRRKRVQLAADLGTFCLPGLAALLVYWAYAPRHLWLYAVSLADFAVVAGLVYLIVSYRERRD